MKRPFHIKALFLDIGGVLLTNGWGHQSRLRAAKHFGFDFDEFNKRHLSIFDTYESGKMNLDEYLELAVFYQPVNFTIDEFRNFIFNESIAYPEMIELMSTIKHQYGLRTIAVNNEPKEINEYRIRQFELDSFIDAFVSSCEVGIRKPDPGIFKLAMGIAQASPEQCYYFDDRAMIVESARGLGMQAFLHKDFETTKGIIETL